MGLESNGNWSLPSGCQATRDFPYFLLLTLASSVHMLQNPQTSENYPLEQWWKWTVGSGGTRVTTLLLYLAFLLVHGSTKYRNCMVCSHYQPARWWNQLVLHLTIRIYCEWSLLWTVASMHLLLYLLYSWIWNVTMNFCSVSIIVVVWTSRTVHGLLKCVLCFYARQHICYSAYMPWQFRLSVCLSHGWISQKCLKLGLCSFHHTVAPSL